MGVHNPPSNGCPQSTLQMDVHNMDVQKKWMFTMDVHNPHFKWMSTIHTPNGCPQYGCPQKNGCPQSTLQWMSTIHIPNGCPQYGCPKKWMFTMDVHNPHFKWMSTIHTPNGCPQSTLQMDVHNMDVHNPNSKWMSTIHTPNGCPLVFFLPGVFREATTEVLFLPGKCSSLQF